MTGREDSTTVTWRGTSKWRLPCLFDWVHCGRVHQSSIYLWGADDNHQLYQDRGHTSWTDIYTGYCLELLLAVSQVTKVTSITDVFKLLLSVMIFIIFLAFPIFLDNKLVMGIL